MRSSAEFYREWYQLHRHYPERGFMIWANNHRVAAALKRAGSDLLVGVFNFSDETQRVSLQFDNPHLPITDESLYRVEDLVYSPITAGYDYFTPWASWPACREKRHQRCGPERRVRGAC